jgi:hypothetical protein
MPCEKANDILPRQQYLPKNKPFDMDDTFNNILSSSQSPSHSSCSPTQGLCSLAHEIASPKFMSDNRTYITEIKLKLVYSAWQNHADLHKTTWGAERQACIELFKGYLVSSLFLQCCHKASCKM